MQKTSIKILVALFVLCSLALVTFGQNTSIQYNLNQPPMATRQVPSAANIYSSPGTTNSGFYLKKFHFKKRHKKQEFTQGPNIISTPLKDEKKDENNSKK